MKVFVTNNSDEDFRVHVTQFADTLGDFSIHKRVSLPTTTKQRNGRQFTFLRQISDTKKTCPTEEPLPRYTM